MSKYVYPAVFHANDDGSYTIIFPDLSGCISEGKDLENALYMAQDALTQYISTVQKMGQELPAASPLNDIKSGDNEFANLVLAELKDNRAVRRTISLPKWMDDRVTSEGISLSKVVQDSLSKRFV